MSTTPMNVVLDEDMHWWFASRTRAILAYLDSYVGAGQNLRVLDVGCGAGNMAHHLDHYGHVIGVDPYPKPLEVARRRGLEVRQASATEMPFPDCSFDLVALLDTVEHIADEAAVFDECRRVLRPGGKLLVTVPALMWLWSNNDVINAHHRRYSRAELNQKLAEHGFVADDASVVFNVGRVWHALDKLNEILHTADGIQMTQASELVLEGNQVDLVAIVLHVHQGLEDQLVGRAVEVVSFYDLHGHVDSRRMENHGTENACFGFDGLRRKACDPVVR